LWFVFVGPNFVVLSFGHVPASRNLAECLNGHSRSPSAPDPNKVTYTIAPTRRWSPRLDATCQLCCFGSAVAL
ncbi:hypothetical protein B0H10DRAFT_2046196, partial [Mycena sp. CBHHK59/15]